MINSSINKIYVVNLSDEDFIKANLLLAKESLPPLSELTFQSIFGDFRSPGIPAYAKPLPTTLHIGKRVRVKEGSWKDWEGVVKDHFICGDDCSGFYGMHKYEVLKDDGTRFSYPSEYFEILE